QHLIEAMACANALSADGILLPHFKEMEPRLDDPRLEWDCRGLRECAEVSENPDLLLCVECTVDAETMKGVCEMAAHPQVGIYYDLGNLKSVGLDPAEQMRAVGDGVKMIHIKEAGADLLGEGEVDMTACVQAMRDIGYDGWLVFETAPTDDPLAAIEHNLAELRKYI
ncbi:MAG: sugar phosphate isomerase/epimerase, partial [Armatimonadetes bacterium]|nr:sugar phosphate isomerase/epimerase [Armatimonadota bacterium]